MRLGVDFSQWGGPLKRETAECWKAQGVKFVIIQYSALTGQHLDVLEEVGGFEITEYVYLYWGQSPWGQTPAERTQLALNAGGNRISRLWLDAEDSTHSYNEAQLKESEGVCNRAGMPTGIYTGRWWWVPNTNNSRAFSHLPLFHAEYKGTAPTPDLSLMPQNFDGFQPYGGWTQPAVWQWWGTTTFCGHSVDLNAAPDVVAVPPGPWQPSKEEAIDALIKAGAVIIAGDQNLADLARVHRESLLWIAKAANP